MELFFPIVLLDHPLFLHQTPLEYVPINFALFFFLRPTIRILPGVLKSSSFKNHRSEAFFESFPLWSSDLHKISEKQRWQTVTVSSLNLVNSQCCWEQGLLTTVVALNSTISHAKEMQVHLFSAVFFGIVVTRVIEDVLWLFISDCVLYSKVNVGNRFWIGQLGRGAF